MHETVLEKEVDNALSPLRLAKSRLVEIDTLEHEIPKLVRGVADSRSKSNARVKGITGTASRVPARRFPACSDDIVD